MARAREWWDASTFVADVALLYFLVTVGNSVMMLTGLDEPKTGSFAYVHLLGRLGIITFIVALFSLDELSEQGRRWWRRVSRRGGPSGARRPVRTVVGDVLDALLRGGIEGSALIFTTVVAVTCALTVAFAGIRPPAGGSGLYRNLVLFAGALLPVLLVASRAWRNRTSARSTMEPFGRGSPRPPGSGSGGPASAAR